MKKMFLLGIVLAVSAGTFYTGLASSKPSLYLNRLAGSNVAVRAVTDPIAALPDSDVVVVFDISNFFSSRLFSTLMTDPKTSAEFKKFETEALNYGIDVRQLRQVVVGGRIDPAKKFNGCLIITGAFDREKMLAGMASKADKLSLQSESYGDRTIYIVTDKSGKAPGTDLKVMDLNVTRETDKVALSFLGQDSIVLGDLDNVKNTIDVQNGKQAGVRGNQELFGYISNTKISSLLRFALITPVTSEGGTKGGKGKVLTNDDLGSSRSSSSSSRDEDDPLGFGKMAESIRGSYGSIDLAAGFNLDTTLLIKSEEEAKKMSEGLSGLLALGKMMAAGQGQKDPKQARLIEEALSGVSVNGSGKDVKVTINLSEPLLKDIFSTFNPTK